MTKPTGIAYFETAPVWSGPRGHHIHPDMIAENCPSETGFRDDGSIVADWSHLQFSESQMHAHLTPHLQPTTVDYILWYLYQSGDLNKVSWNKIQSSLETAFPNQKVCRWLWDEGAKENKSDDDPDRQIHGFAAVCRKNKQNPIARRLIWRLRRVGL